MKVVLVQCRFPFFLRFTFCSTIHLLFLFTCFCLNILRMGTLPPPLYRFGFGFIPHISLFSLSSNLIYL